MNSNPLISILIPCYNHEKFIQETIESIWQQNIDELEIIVIDDGSKDNSFQKLQELQKSSPVSMHIETQLNVGITKTLNRCLVKAKGDYIAIIASDDLYYSNALMPMIKVLQNNSEIKVVYGTGHSYSNGKIFGEVHNHNTRKLLSLKPVEIEKKLRTHVPRPLLTQCCMYDKKMLNEINGWDEEIKLDDWPLNIKIFEYLKNNNFSHLFMEHNVILYRDHENNINKKTLKMLELVEEVIQKYTPVEKRAKFLAREYFGHGKYLLTNKDSLNGNRLLMQSIRIYPSLRHTLNTLRVMIKYNLKNYLN
jgi:alpha-1,3-rhamnosyltransferase